MPPINFLVACMVIVAMLAVLKSYLPLITADLTRGKFAFHLTRATALGSAVSIIRLGYWDILQYLSHDHWEVIRESLGGQRFSSLFNVLLLFVARDLLIARLYLIDREERHHWRWWNVAGHPTHMCLFDWRRGRTKGRQGEIDDD